MVCRRFFRLAVQIAMETAGKCAVIPDIFPLAAPRRIGADETPGKSKQTTCKTQRNTIYSSGVHNKHVTYRPGRRWHQQSQYQFFFSF